LCHISGDAAPSYLPSRPSQVRIPSIGYVNSPIEGEAGRWCSCAVLAASHLLPGASQMVPALFRRIWPRSDLATTCWKGHCWLLRLYTKRMVHVSRQASTRVVPGDGKPSHFCLECRCVVCVNPRSIRLAAFSRPRSRCYPLLYRPPVLRLLCADETSSARWTICVLPCAC